MSVSKYNYQEPAPEGREGGVRGSLNCEHHPGCGDREMEFRLEVGLQRRQVPGHAALRDAENQAGEKDTRHPE